MTVLIFAASYLALAVGHLFSFKINRTGIALLGAILMVTAGRFPPHDALLSVNFPTLITLYGLMILSGQFWLSGFYTWVAQKISLALDRPKTFLLLLILTSGLLSAFLINDVVCFAFTPVVTLALSKRRLNPVPFLIGVAAAANIGAAATPIGNPQNIVIASIAELHFGSYLLWCLPPTLFSLFAAYAVIWWIGRKEFADAPATTHPIEEFPPLDRRETLKGLVLLGIIIPLFFTQLPRPLVILGAAGLLLLSRRIAARDLLKKVDYSILTLFTGLFIIVGGLQETQLPEQALHYLQSMGIQLHNPYVLTLVTATLSDLMSNAAAVMLLAKTLVLKNPTTAYVLALSNSYAGNFLLIGSIANLIVVEQARSLGVKIHFRHFAKYGIPVAVCSFAILLGWIWLRS